MRFRFLILAVFSVIDTILAAILFGNRIRVSTCFVEFNLTECGGRSAVFILLAVSADFYSRSIRRHRSVILCRQVKGKSLRLRPVVEILGDTEDLVNRGKCIRDGQALLPIILHHCRQLIG